MADWTTDEMIAAYQNNEIFPLITFIAFEDQHAGQVVTLETVIECRETFATVEAYHNSTEAECEDMRLRALARAQAHPTANVDLLSLNSRRVAYSAGEGYFVNGHEYMLSQKPPEEWYSFQSEP